ncbi:DUF2793 domain-containing protein [Rhizobiales bacterium TNE-4]|nr:DUF2793 domain-containing protein [Rhizobiales bacterium TNE-4]MBV1826583.1 DUF2793 domain-containing protein [Rhizobiales bacterium TNE-4]
MTMTPILALPLLAAAQAQKHVTLNEALFLLDSLVQIAVIEKGRNTPPDAPRAGDRYIVGPSPAGSFAGKPGLIAAFDGAQWSYTEPRAGFLIFVTSENQLYLHDGNSLKTLKELIGAPEEVARLGIGTGVDANHSLSVKGASALFAARGNGEGGTGHFRMTLNKDASSAILSHLYQTRWSARAETGLLGDENYRIKMSPDGAAWFDAFSADAVTGAVRLPSGLASIGGGSLAFRNLIVNPEGVIAQRGNGPFNAAGATPVAAFDRWRLSGGASTNASLARTALTGANAGLVQGPYLTWAVTAASSAANAVLETRLDQLLALAGKRVTVSFRYRSNAAISLALMQNFGTGGSSVVASLMTNALPVSSQWRSIAFTLTLPAATGKTIGSSPFLALQCAATQPVICDLAEVQLEEGFLTPFERRPPAFELLLCRRYFRRSAVSLNAADLAIEMRVPPLASGTGPFDYDSEFEG